MIHPARRIRIPFYGLLLVERNNRWYGRPVLHNPVWWKWWQVFQVSLHKTSAYSNRKDYNLWLYTRADAICIHVALVDNRNLPGVMK